MAKATKLPSGAYRTQANKKINGKMVRKSFTVHPKECGNDWRKAKDLSELKAREWLTGTETTYIKGLTVKEAIQSYIDDKSKVLSPSTIRGYKLILGNFNSIEDIYISEIDTPQIQRIINEWAIDLKQKTIKNRITLLLSVLDYHGIDKRFKVRYPQNASKKVGTPDIEEVKIFIANAGDVMKPIIYLAAFGSLRRGEIAGLREKDISRKNNTITVNGVKVLTPDNKWIYKPFPKTKDSIRTIPLPEFIIDSIPISHSPDGFIFDLTPAAMSDRFCRLAKRLNLDYSLHSMRHFAASFRTDLGIPKKYIQETGGWLDGSSSIFERVYDNKMDSSRQKYNKIANDFIEETFRN